ncbi:hypothetical protein Taro_042283 [Colocasia esculenta]|uniref:Subtilisin-like protease n=1 Tax=Colocasia esculenta TaxID=4460 RepID=A0A843WGF4_COLES|nr:hypothetical protein [Colocasia esculenta]
MATLGRRPTLLLLLFLASVAGATSQRQRQGDALPGLQTYIVHMNTARKPEVHPTRAKWYAAHLQSLSIDPDQHLLYSYSTAFQGFAASLRPDHLPLLRSSPAVLHVHPDPVLSLHTTRSPEFLGLSQSLKPGSSSSGNDSTSSPASSAAVPSSPFLLAAEAATKDVIVGVLDTGVWPESKSFNDAGLPEIPARWRGTCEAGVDFAPSLCNRKLIGARSFSRGFRAATATSGGGEREGGDKPKEYASARDRDGHGTHTASTAAGSPVANASLLGYAPGTARGMATSARVAVYKVCWASGCFGSDILAGMDAAISDGVDVLSLSLGGGAAPYFRDTIAIGAFAAAEHGIFVSCSAGNSGPRSGSLANTAPWILTVGAGTIDRDFPAYATLGNGERYTGVSLYSGPGMGKRMVLLVYAPPAPSGKGKAVNGSSSSSSNLCLPGTLDPAHVRGKVVFCDRGTNARVEKGQVVKAAGGVGMILANTVANGEELVADSHLLPAVAVGRKTGDMIREYARSDPAPRTVLAFGGTVLNVRPSPVVAAFSSRGPNGVTPEILKPDVIGPGVNILAAWSGAVGPTGLAKDQRRSDFNIMSGTSMSCPHVSGIAALLKAAHPEWSPSAIKSALMTTAYTVDNTGSPLSDAAGGSLADPYAYGSGHVDPRKALSPGLIYDITTEDYIAFLCSLNYSLDEVQAVVKRANITCSRRFRGPGDLNYPSFSVVFDGKSKKVVRYTRELTNVGAAGSVYDVKIRAPAGVTVTVKPTRLVFREVGQKLKYSATFFAKKGRDQMGTSFGWITWINKKHQVRSPVAYRWNMVR